MLVSLKNLAKLVDIKGLSAEEIAHGLTFSGIEVEEISTLASATNLVIGEVLECVAHPNSDHLHVLQVNLGEKYGVNQIVCGAPNARSGLKVIVAMVGAKLPGGEISKSTIRGVESNGMCCSLLELGVERKYLSDAQVAGIEELPSDAPIGEEDVLGYLGLDDEVLNLNVLANRPDLLSLMNVAREVGAIFHREVKLPEAKPIVNMKSDLIVGSATDKCSQFSGKEVRNIVVKDSPKWMQEFLTSMGVRSINNIVDIGNYVMLMTGQPLHMYDADKLPKKELIAKSDLEGDFVALDEKTYKIIPGDIVITSDNHMMCLGGVMGSLECAVDESTKNVYIEAASFDHKSIRHTSNRLGLVSESSQRFVKGTNHFQSEYVLEFTADLMRDLCEGQDFGDVKVYQSEQQVKQIIPSSVTRINNRLGTHFSEEQIISTLESLGFKVTKLEDDKFEAEVPTYRLDVTCDADLSEEVIRILGFDNVESELPVMETTIGSLNESQLKERRIEEYLLGQGLDECLTYSLVSNSERELFAFVNHDEDYKILNPLTDDHEYFRKNVLYSLIEVASYNVSHQNKNLALFEVSNVYTKNQSEKHLAIVLVGKESRQALLESRDYDFYSMKGLVEGMMEVLGIEESRYMLKRNTTYTNELHPGRSADIIIQGKVIGSFGELHPDLSKTYNFGKEKVIILELNLSELISLKVGIIKAKGYSRYPSVSRDLALVVSKDVDSGDLIKLIKSTGKSMVKSAQVFDVFEGAILGDNKKSLAITITYSSDDHTLSDKEVSDMEDKIKLALASTYHATLRM